MSTHTPFKRLLAVLCSFSLLFTLAGHGFSPLKPVLAEGAISLALQPSSTSYAVDSAGTFDMIVTPGAEAITGAEVHVTYDATKINVTSISFNSVLDNFFDLSTDGEISILGISGNNSSKTITTTTRLATVQFTATAPGTVTLHTTKAQFVEQGSSTVSDGSSTDRSFMIQAAPGSTTPPSGNTSGSTPNSSNSTNNTSTTTNNAGSTNQNTTNNNTSGTEQNNSSTGSSSQNNPPAEDTPPAPEAPSAPTPPASPTPPPAPAPEPPTPETSTLTAVRFSISGNSTIEVGAVASLVAFAQYSDGRSENVTSPSSHPGTRYESADPGVADLRCVGCSSVVGIAPGQARLRVTYTEGNVTKTNSTTLTVTAPATEAEPAASEPQEPASPAVEPPAPPAEDTTSANPSTPATDNSSSNASGTANNESEHPAAPDTPPSASDSLSADSDGDGLSDAMERLLGTNPEQSASSEVEDPGWDRPRDPVQDPGWDRPRDPVQDPGWDHPGINDSTRVILGLDVNALRQPGEVRLIKISNLSNGDVLGGLSPNLFGTVSRSAKEVTLSATRADYSVLNDLKDALAILTSAPEGIERDDLKNLQRAVDAARYYSDGKTGERLHPELAEVIRALSLQLSELQEANQGRGELTPDSKNKDNFAESLKRVADLVSKAGPLTLGTVTAFNDFDASAQVNQRVKYFHLVGGGYLTTLTDHKEYLITATATLADGSTLSSEPVLIGIDSAAAIQAPRGVTLNSRSVPRNSLTGGDLSDPGINRSSSLGFDAFADARVTEMSIQETRPVIAGNTDFNSQVFAVWESVVLASATIADSEAGSFAIQAPKNLASDESHKVTVYAIKNAEGKKIQSKSVTVHFRIQPESFSPLATGGIIILLLLLATALWGIKRALGKKLDHSATPVAIPSPAPVPSESAQATTPAEESKPTSA